jgi:hypothetical protein
MHAVRAQRIDDDKWCLGLYSCAVIDSHDIAERARLLSHRLYATRLEMDAGLLDAARSVIEGRIRGGGGTIGERVWAQLLRAGMDEIVERMLDQGEEGRLLRANSPFSILIGVTDPDMRKSLWRQARVELSDKRISTVRSAA